MFCLHEAKWSSQLQRTSRQVTASAISACWLNWLVRVPFTCRGGGVVRVHPSAQHCWGVSVSSKPAALKQISNKENNGRRTSLLFETTSFRWSQPLLCLDLCRKFQPRKFQPRLALAGAKWVAASRGQRSDNILWQLCRKTARQWRRVALGEPPLVLWCIKCSSEIARCSWKRVIFCCNQLRYFPPPLCRH